MSEILIRVSYDGGVPYGDRTGQVFGTMYTATKWVFDTATETVSQQSGATYDDFQDSNHPEEFNYDGEFYHVCAGTTRRGFTGDQRGGFTVAEVTNSTECGYTAPAPLTCDLGTASVDQEATANGAKLTAQYSGTANGQMKYRLDSGPEQTSTVFLDVAPGAHTLHFRDQGLAGCTRSVDVVVAAPPTSPTETPPALTPAEGVDFVQQPLWYTVADVPAGASVVLQLYAESYHGAEDFALVLPLRKYAARAGSVAFRLDTLLLPLLAAVVPPVQELASYRCTTNLLSYYVRTTVRLAGQDDQVHQSPLRTALRGGLPAEWQQTDYFHFRQQPPFALPPCLSWQPTGPGAYAAGLSKSVTYQQPEWLYWLCPVDVAGLKVARSYDMGAGTVPVVDYEALPAAPARGWQRQLLAIPLRPGRVGFLRMSVQVRDGQGEPLSQAATYTFVPATERTRYLLFTNSLGGVDTLRCEGRLEAALEATTEKVELPAVPGTSAPAADRQLTDLSASRKLKLTTAWLTTAELAWVQELVLSRAQWLQVAGQLRPLDWPKRSLAVYSDEPGLRKLQLEFDYAYAPTAYAPGTY